MERKEVMIDIKKDQRGEMRNEEKGGKGKDVKRGGEEEEGSGWEEEWKKMGRTREKDRLVERLPASYCTSTRLPLLLLRYAHCPAHCPAHCHAMPTTTNGIELFLHYKF